MKKKGKQLLGELESPMSFLGHERADHVIIEGERIPLRIFLKEANNSKDRAVRLLNDRYDQIVSLLKEGELPEDELTELYLEGLAVKRSIYMMVKKDISVDHEDIERWLKFGKRIR